MYLIYVLSVFHSLVMFCLILRSLDYPDLTVGQHDYSYSTSPQFCDHINNCTRYSPSANRITDPNYAYGKEKVCFSKKCLGIDIKATSWFFETPQEFFRSGGFLVPLNPR